MSKTRDNLFNMIKYESQARTRYSRFAEIAREEGYHYIAKIFEETAENEYYHAMQAFKFVSENQDTITNVKEAITGETYEAEKMYPSFADEAEKEGDMKAAILFNQITKIEKHHRDRFNNILNLLEAGQVFKRDHPIKWKCSVCGYTHDGNEPPNRCPYCKKPKEYYEPANLDV